MTLFVKNSDKIRSVASFLQLACLLAAGVFEFLVIITGNMFDAGSHYLLCVGSGISCLFFLLATMLRSPLHILRRNKIILLSAAMVGWFLVVELLHRSNQLGSHSISLFFSVYLTAFPFAAVTQNHTQKNGLRFLSKLYIAGAAILLLYSFFLFIDHTPALLQHYVYWDGSRLFPIHHPNIAARIFMIAIAFCLGFLAQCKRKSGKGLLLAAIAILFMAVALTNSRACVLVTCLLLAGNVFFVIYRGKRKAFLCAAAAAVIATAVLFTASNTLFQWNSNRLLEHPATPLTAEQQVSADTPAAQLSRSIGASANAEEPTSNAPQGSWLSDLVTLNSRTLIWTEVFNKIRHSPHILLWGTDSTRLTTETFDVAHTHNAWLEVLLRLGLPGFILSLVFTVQAIWSALCLLWNNSLSLWEKNIAMLVLALLVTSLIEPFLFFTPEAYHPIDFIFFLCLGYLILWRKQTAHNN